MNMHIPGVNCLRSRRHGCDTIEMLRAPFAQSGRLVGIDEQCVEMLAGRIKLRFFVSDFARLLDGYDNALRLLSDAVRHRDFVELRVLGERLSYKNEAQYARLLAQLP